MINNSENGDNVQKTNDVAKTEGEILDHIHDEDKESSENDRIDKGLLFCPYLYLRKPCWRYLIKLYLSNKQNITLSVKKSTRPGHMPEKLTYFVPPTTLPRHNRPNLSYAVQQYI